MNTKDLSLLFNYNYWANGQILAATKKVTLEQFIAPAEFPFGGLRGTLAHILGAEQAWRVRFEGMAHLIEDYPETAFPTVEALEAKWREDEASMRAYLASLREDDLEKGVSYPLDNGKTRTRILWHCLIHLANHGTQHRSEAAALLTRFGQSPGDLDFGVFLMGVHPPVDV
jgi:uncharacterized damage-inducible protein DinB